MSTAATSHNGRQPAEKNAPAPKSPPTCWIPPALRIENIPCDHSKAAVNLECSSCHNMLSMCFAHYIELTAAFMAMSHKMAIRHKPMGSYYHHFISGETQESRHIASIVLPCVVDGCGAIMLPANPPPLVEIKSLLPARPAKIVQNHRDNNSSKTHDAHSQGDNEKHSHEKHRSNENSNNQHEEAEARSKQHHSHNGHDGDAKASHPPEQELSPEEAEAHARAAERRQKKAEEDIAATNALLERERAAREAQLAAEREAARLEEEKKEALRQRKKQARKSKQHQQHERHQQPHETQGHRTEKDDEGRCDGRDTRSSSSTRTSPLHATESSPQQQPGISAGPILPTPLKVEQGATPTTPTTPQTPRRLHHPQSPLLPSPHLSAAAAAATAAATARVSPLPRNGPLLPTPRSPYPASQPHPGQQMPGQYYRSSPEGFSAAGISNPDSPAAMPGSPAMFSPALHPHFSVARGPLEQNCASDMAPAWTNFARPYGGGPAATRTTRPNSHDVPWATDSIWMDTVSMGPASMDRTSMAPLTGSPASRTVPPTGFGEMAAREQNHEHSLLGVWSNEDAWAVLPASAPLQTPWIPPKHSRDLPPQTNGWQNSWVGRAAGPEPLPSTAAAAAAARQLWPDEQPRSSAWNASILPAKQGHDGAEEEAMVDKAVSHLENAILMLSLLRSTSALCPSSEAASRAAQVNLESLTLAVQTLRRPSSRQDHLGSGTLEFAAPSWT